MITVLQTLRNRFLPHWLFLIYLPISSWLYFSGLGQVPFHPDESTQIYMSTDAIDYFTNIADLAINPNEILDQKQVYRLLDAPLTRYLIGISYQLTGNHPLKTDWDWSKSWDENIGAGALPAQRELYVARMTIGAFFPLTILLIYCLGNALDGRLAGIGSAVILGTNALVHLHTRRAMAEGILLFGVTALLAVILLAPKRICLLGIVSAFAISAKYSSFGFLPVCAIALLWHQEPLPNRSKFVLTRFSIFFGIFLFITLLLNPAYWHSPLKTLELAIQLRQDLISRQVNEIGMNTPEQVLISKTDRLAVLVANLYLTPPMLYELGNYRQELAGEYESYLANPFHKVLRSTTGAGLLIFFTISGFIWSLGQIKTSREKDRRMGSLLVLSFIFELITLIMFVPLPWQRYVIPLVPLIAIFSGIGISRSIKNLPLEIIQREVVADVH